MRQLVTIVLYVYVCFLGVDLISQCDRERDSLALVQLYTGLNGISWDTTWNLIDPFESWKGIQVDQTGCVQSLVLNGNNISGYIDTSIGNLIQLEQLSIFGTDLSDTIPNSLYELPNLKRLELFLNNLTGDLSPSIIGLQSLERLRLHNNQLSGNFPLELSQLPNLNFVFLSSNNFSGCFESELSGLCDLGVTNTVNGLGYNFLNNPLLPWEGDFLNFCNGENQIGSPCNDDNPNTLNDTITNECECVGTLNVVQNICRQRDSLALIELYNATHENGPWTNEWDLDLPVDSWFGVSLNSEGCVSCLDLDGVFDCQSYGITLDNNLSGILSDSIFNLLDLEFLDFLYF